MGLYLSAHSGAVSVEHQLTLQLEKGAARLASAQLEPSDTDIDDLVDACRSGQQRMNVLVRTVSEQQWQCRIPFHGRLILNHQPVTPHCYPCQSQR